MATEQPAAAGEADEGIGASTVETVAKLESLLGPDSDTPKDSKADVSEPAEEAGQPELLEDEAEDADLEELLSEAEDLDPEEAESPDEDEEDRGEEEELPPDTLVTVKIDGETEQVTLREAANGYQRQSDYSRKMSKLAEERLALENELEAVRTEREKYAEGLNRFADSVHGDEIPEPDWETLYQEDPVNFPIVEKRWRQYKERLAYLDHEQSQLQDQIEADKNAQLEQQVAEGREALLKMHPEWQDPGRWDKVRKEIATYGQEIGYTPEELSQIYDPRAILLLDAARRYHALKKNRPQPVRDSVGNMKPGSPNRSPRSKSKKHDAEKRLAQSGSVDDAVEIFKLLEI